METQDQQRSKIIKNSTALLAYFRGMETYTGSSLPSCSLKGKDLVVPGGLGQVVEHLESNITKSSSLKTGCEVVLIDYSEEKTKIEYLEDGEKKMLTADYVIVTLPVGVLQARMDNLFQPKVPLAKVKFKHFT